MVKNNAFSTETFLKNVLKNFTNPNKLFFSILVNNSIMIPVQNNNIPASAFSLSYIR